MNPQTITAITQALTPLANKLSVGANQLFAIYIRQEIINGLTYVRKNI